MRARARLACVAVLAAALGAVLALALGPGARVARAALPCGLLNPCTTSTAPATLPTATATTITTATTTTTVAPVKAPRAYPGTTYDGRSASFSDAVIVQVATSGKALRGWFVQFAHGSCSDGGSYGGDDYSQQTAPLSATGTASETVSLRTGHAFWHTKAGQRVNGAERYRAHFTFAGKTVTGTLEDTFSSAKLSCHSGAVHFTAFLDGTPQAPVRTQGVATGVYRATGATVDVYAPWKAVTEVKATDTVSCPKVKAQRATLTLFDLPIDLQPGTGVGYFSHTLHETGHLSHGITSRETIELNGAVKAKLGTRTENYVADVLIRGSIDYYADGQQITYVCTILGDHVAIGPKHLPLLIGGVEDSALRPAARQFAR